MLHYLWLRDRKHLKREELKENQNERDREEGGATLATWLAALSPITDTRSILSFPKASTSVPKLQQY